MIFKDQYDWKSLFIYGYDQKIRIRSQLLQTQK